LSFDISVHTVQDIKYKALFTTSVVATQTTNGQKERKRKKTAYKGMQTT